MSMVNIHKAQWNGVPVLPNSEHACFGDNIAEICTVEAVRKLQPDISILNWNRRVNHAYLHNRFVVDFFALVNGTSMNLQNF